MSFQLEYIGAIPVVGADGALSRSSTRWLDDMIFSIVKSGQPTVILDLSKVNHIDYKFVQYLSERITELKNVGGGIMVAAANHYVRSIFEAMGCHEKFYPSVGEALLNLFGESVHRPWQ